MRRRRDVPRIGDRDWFPDHTAERRTELARTTPAQRVAEAIALSRTATRIAAAAHHQRERNPTPALVGRPR
jgi:hypothetical protein